MLMLGTDALVCNFEFKPHVALVILRACLILGVGVLDQEPHCLHTKVTDTVSIAGNQSDRSPLHRSHPPEGSFSEMGCRSVAIST